jgi:hypothetical protein
MDSEDSFSSSTSAMDESPRSQGRAQDEDGGSYRRNLTFNETVSVVHIPRRDEYSKRIQSHLWHTSNSLQENIMRNTIEFAAEGWDWQSVLEEDDYIPCPESGELIHPVHCEIARLLRQQRGLPETADSMMELLNTR